MNLNPLLHSQTAADLGMSLLHTLWQGPLIGLTLYACLAFLPAERCRRRYALSTAALLLTVLCWVATFAALQYDPAAPSVPLRDQPGIEALPAAAPEGTAVAVRTIAPTPAVPERGLQVRLLPWMLGGWLAGVCVMLGRMFVATAGAARLRRESFAMDDPAVGAMFDELCRHMKIRRSVRFRVCCDLVYPGVIGFLSPMLLVPTSVLSEVPLDDLRVILAHELAHIRRFDYLVNFCQMIVEALLFFNPAVWWISRQIRIEREACCDRAGIEAAGRPVRYAQILYEQVARMAKTAPGVPAAVTGFSDGHRGAADRVRRIVRPRHRPHMKIGGLRLTLCLLIAAAVLAGLWKTADATVALAGRMFSPAEQIEKMEQITEAYGAAPRLNYENATLTVAGTVRTHDGAELPRDRKIMMESYGGRSSSITFFQLSADGTFRQTSEYHPNFFIYVDAEGYAPAFSEAYTVEPDAVIEDMELVLEEGFVGEIRVNDPQGRPIEGAAVRKVYFHASRDGWSGFGHSDTLTTDAGGIVRFRQCVERPIKVNVNAAGYRPVDGTELILRPGEPAVVTLEAGLRAGGRVVDRDSGNPIASAEFRLVYKEKPGHGWSYGDEGQETGVVTDSAGRFDLDTLAEGFTYSYVIRAEGYNRTPLARLEAGEMNRTVEMGPVREIRGRILGDLSGIGIGTAYASDIREPHPLISYRGNYRDEAYGHLDENGDLAIVVTDGVGHFTLRDFLGDRVVFSPNGTDRRKVVEVDRDFIDDVVIDMDVPERPTREVMFTFQVPEGYPPVKGSLNLWYMTREVHESDNRAWSGLEMAVTNGVGTMACPQDAYIRLTDAGGIAGFWIDPDEWEPAEEHFVAASDEPYRRTIPVEPAGGIYGEILDDTGAPRKFAQMKLLIVERPERYKDVKRFSRIRSSMDFRHPIDETRTGRFHTQSLPLGGTYAVLARDEATWLVSEPIRLTAEDPIREIVLRPGRLGAIRGRVLLPNGSPAAGAEVALAVSAKYGDDPDGAYSTILQETPVTDDGTFVLERLNTGDPLSYSLRVDPPAGYQPLRQEVTPGKTYTLRLKKGYSLRGRVLDQTTGWPIPGAQVYAQAIDDAQHVRVSDALTAKDGTFVFTSLDDVQYQLFVPGLEIIEPDVTANRFVGGALDRMEIRGTLQSWSPLKPREPPND